MPRHCTQCGSGISDDDRRCPACGVEWDEDGSDEDNEFKTQTPIVDTPSRPARPERVERRTGAAPSSRTPMAAPEPVPTTAAGPAAARSKPRPKPAQRPARPAAAAMNAASPAAAPAVPENFGPAPPLPPPPPGPAPRPGRLRSWLINCLGGAVEAPPSPQVGAGATGWPAVAPPVAPAYAPGHGTTALSVPAYSAPSMPAPAGVGVQSPLSASSSAGYPPVPAGPDPAMAGRERASAQPGALPPLLVPATPAPPLRAQPAYFAPDSDDVEGPLGGPGDEDLTVYESLDVGKMKLASQTYVLQVRGTNGGWVKFGWIVPPSLTVGRTKGSEQHLPSLATMSSQHMRFFFDGGKLFVEPLKSLNGVYVSISRPARFDDGMEMPQAIALENGQRFRVGSQVMEFRTVDPVDRAAPLVSSDHETFHSFDLLPMAYVVLIRPDGTDGLYFPITKEETLIGRKDIPGASIAIALTGDRFTSKVHARVVRYRGGFWLQNLTDKQTFLAISGPAELSSGDEVMAGAVRFLVVLLPTPTHT